MKRCAKCKKLKSENKFHKKISTKDGLHYSCIECEREYNRKYKKRNRKRTRTNLRYEDSHRIIDGVKQKRCTKCKKWKKESEFGKNSSTRDGLNFWCKKCTRKLHGKGDEPVKRYYSYEEAHRVVSNVKEKRCRRCLKWKAESEFYRLHKSKDGLCWYCKKCIKEEARKYRERRLAVRN